MSNHNHNTSEDVLRSIFSAPAKKRDAALAAASQALHSQAPDQLLVNQSEAARLLSVSKCTVWRMVKSGALHPIKVLGAVRYSVEELRRLATTTLAAA